MGALGLGKLSPQKKGGAPGGVDIDRSLTGR